MLTISVVLYYETMQGCSQKHAHLMQNNNLIVRLSHNNL